eukprot:6758806-Prymnesium_polylepis.1
MVTASSSDLLHKVGLRTAARRIGISEPSFGVPQVSGLLGAEQPEDLSNALCTRRLVTRDDEITVPLTLEQANDSRE